MSELYMIYKGSGGLAHMLGGIYHALIIAKRNNRKLIIDTEAHIAFRHKFSDFFTINGEKWSDDYSTIPQHYTFQGRNLDDIKKHTLMQVNKKYGLFNVPVTSKNYKKTDNLVVWAGTSGTKGKWVLPGLKVSANIMEKLKKEPKINGKYLSIHYRNTDLKNKAGRFISILKKLVNKTKINTVYLATDDVNALGLFKKNLPNVKFIQKANLRSNIKNMHYSSKVKAENYSQIYETLRDMYYIMQSVTFIPSPNSGMSRFLYMQMLRKINIFDLPPTTNYLL